MIAFNLIEQNIYKLNSFMSERTLCNKHKIQHMCYHRLKNINHNEEIILTNLSLRIRRTIQSYSLISIADLL